MDLQTTSPYGPHTTDVLTEPSTATFSAPSVIRRLNRSATPDCVEEVLVPDDRAVGVCDQDILLQSVNSTIWLVSSPQHDVYERRGGVWRIAYRRVWPAHSAQLPARLLV